jgi:hypothetical protein
MRQEPPFYVQDEHQLIVLSLNQVLLKVRAEYLHLLSYTHATARQIYFPGDVRRGKEHRIVGVQHHGLKFYIRGAFRRNIGWATKNHALSLSAHELEPHCER